ncbi:hypothetical protein BV341_05714 [Pseudomonas syringae pv. actinidiae]|nr:hypothetical protein BV341_05714 [Pseudomonas syringae pv. actinidiae]
MQHILPIRAAIPKPKTIPKPTIPPRLLQHQPAIHALQKLSPLLPNGIFKPLIYQVPQDVRHSHLRHALFLRRLDPVHLHLTDELIVLGKQQQHGDMARYDAREVVEKVLLDGRYRAVGVGGRDAVPDCVERGVGIRRGVGLDEVGDDAEGGVGEDVRRVTTTVFA